VRPPDNGRARTRRWRGVSVTVVTDIVPFVLSSVVAATSGTTPAGPLVELLIIVVGTVIVMLARGFDRRRTLLAMPTNTLYMETSRRGQQLLIARDHTAPAVHMVSNTRKAVTK